MSAGRVGYRVTFAVLATGGMAYALMQSLVIPALPTIQAQLHTSQSTVTWVVTGYLLSASVSTPIIGRLGDMWGKERMLVVALAALGVGCVLSAVADSIGVMIAGRVIQGLGGGVLPLAFGVIRDEFPAERVPGAVGTIAALTAVGAGLGIVLAGPIVSALSYRWLFWIPTIMLAIAAAASHFVVPASPVRATGRVNWLAAALLSSWLVALLLPISEAPSWGWGSTRVVALLVVAAVLAAVWIAVESRAASPLIDMRMMRLPVVWSANLVGLLFGVGMYAGYAFMPQFLQTPSSAGYGFGASIGRVGLILLPGTAVNFVFGLSSGRLIGRFDSKRVLIAGASVTAVGYCLLAAFRGHIWQIVMAQVITGGGFGLAFAAMSSLVVEGVPVEQTGVASGMNATLRTIGGSIGAAAVGTVIVGSAHGHGLPTSAGYTEGFVAVAIVTLLAFVATLLVPTQRRALSAKDYDAALPHPELNLLPAGTLIGDEPE